MNRSTNPFVNLADRAERGDAIAKTQLRRQLEPELIHIVRRVIQEGRGRTMLDRRILAEASRVGLDVGVHSGEERERLLLVVAQRVCSTVVSRLRHADNQPAEETVCTFGSLGA